MLLYQFRLAICSTLDLSCRFVLLAAIFDLIRKLMLGITMASVSALPAYTKEVTERPDSSRLATYFDLFFSALARSE